MHQEVETKLNEMSRNHQDFQTSCRVEWITRANLGLEFAESLSHLTRPSATRRTGRQKAGRHGRNREKRHRIYFDFTTVMTRLAVTITAPRFIKKKKSEPHCLARIHGARGLTCMCLDPAFQWQCRLALTKTKLESNVL